jgi:maleylacetoacetate isomerase
MVLYDYFRSSAAYRVRIALAIKGIAVERRFVHLLRDGGEHLRPDFLSKNPQGLVPALELETGVVLTQSLAIIDYLETLSPEPSLVPSDPALAARARAAALVIACDTHPLGNLRVANYLQQKLGQDERAVLEWRRHWITLGLEAIEATIDPSPFCFSSTPSIADVCLAPQLYSAARFGVDIAGFPKIRAVAAVCAGHPAFRAAHPQAQPDAAEAAAGP